MTIRVEHEPVPVTMTDRLRQMTVGECIFVEGSADSIKSLVSRVKSEFDGRMRRDYKTRAQKDRGGAQVWRTK